MTIHREEFRTAWPQVVRTLAARTHSLDLGEEYAAEAFARATEQPPGLIDDLPAWCVRVGHRAWLDDVRRAERFGKLRYELIQQASEPDGGAPVLDDRLAMLFVACDDVLAPGAQLVLAMRLVCGLTTRQIATHLGISSTTAAARLTRAKASLARARPGFEVPEAVARTARLPLVLACVSALLTVGQRELVDPDDPAVDPGRDALTLAETLAQEYPKDAEAIGLRACCRLALGRRPGRVRDGVALPLEEADRTAWNPILLRAGLADVARANALTQAPGRFVLEAAISGLHTTIRRPDAADWATVVGLYDALVRQWPSPAAHVARLVAMGRRELTAGGDLTAVERDLEQIVTDGPDYAARDATFALADLEHRTNRATESAARYRELAETVPEGPLREFCRLRARI
ncbi:DUF6596 domain-containing protein [Ruania alba]|uniref:RNA polymerase sigma-70 factor, ECF subfamily n=1 Tax=Ruania alba TaxID=648782 RepID=A0A1H5LBV8_9MICO|nr:DUF6596 domain-containing protein [Ruania alba]SEE73728.1 RNA polymerase sigma-70 factor, ECF subfamily [Ruania alba]